MFKVNTPDGERFLVQLVGPKSYRMGAQITYRGQTLTVTKRTRDYLVRKTKGAWTDFDPTPPEPIDEVMPPQFGDPTHSLIDMEDLDPARNPAMSMEHASALAAKGQEHHVDVTDLVGAQSGAGAPEPGPVEVDTADLQQVPQGTPDAPDGSGDMTGSDLKKGQSKSTGGATATKAPAKAEAKPKGGVVIKQKPADETAMEIT